jgi:hypothetical protein
MGDAAQVPTQWSEGVAAVATVEPVEQRVSRESRRRESLPVFEVMTVLIAIGSTLHITAVSWRSVVHV